MPRLLLVLLAWAQVSLAAHQFEHSLDEAGEHCSVCLLSERYDDVVADTDHTLSAPGESPVLPVRAQTELHTPGFAPYLTRASP